MDVHVEDMINKIKKCNVEKKEVYCIHTYAHINVNLCIEMHFDWYRCCFSSFWWHSFVWFFYWHYSNFLHSALNWGHPPYATAFIFWKHILKLFPDAFCLTLLPRLRLQTWTSYWNYGCSYFPSDLSLFTPTLPISKDRLCSPCKFKNISHHLLCGLRLVRFVHLFAPASSDGFPLWFM